MDQESELKNKLLLRINQVLAYTDPQEDPVIKALKIRNDTEYQNIIDELANYGYNPYLAVIDDMSVDPPKKRLCLTASRQLQK